MYVQLDPPSEGAARQLAAVAERRRLLALRPRVLAKDRGDRGIVDAARGAARQLIEGRNAMRRIALAAFAVAFLSASAQAQNFSAEEIANRAIHRRAVEAVIWGMPVVNYDLMYQEMVRKTKGEFNQVLYWSRLLDWKNQTLTPNPDVIYLMPFFNTKDVGPVVLEVPPADDGVFNGSIMNRWQAAIEDIGPGGVDKGKGGKYLILPPGYDKDKVPAGYIPMPSDS